MTRTISQATPPAALTRLVEERTGEVLLFGLTPPRASAGQDKVSEIAARTLARVNSLDIDGLVLYDLDDESDRTPEPRPFPYLPTMDPAEYRSAWLDSWQGPTIVYRSVGKYDEPTLDSWLGAQPADGMTVFVGASSRNKPVKTTLRQAMQVRRERHPGVKLGGVAIPERHTRRGNEHERLLHKQAAGCSFFVSQVVYNVMAAKDLLSDYVYTCRDEGVQPAPFIFTLSLCGSTKTLEFLNWLGIAVPRWVSNELLHGHDPLRFSLGHCIRVATDLAEFARHLDTPFGFNIESVSNRRLEIEAAMELTGEVRAILR